MFGRCRPICVSSKDARHLILVCDVGVIYVNCWWCEMNIDIHSHRVSKLLTFFITLFYLYLPQLFGCICWWWSSFSFTCLSQHWSWINLNTFLTDWSWFHSGGTRQIRISRISDRERRSSHQQIKRTDGCSVRIRKSERLWSGSDHDNRQERGGRKGQERSGSSHCGTCKWDSNVS